MNGLALATVAYFIIALEVILDKFLLTSKRVSHPAVYAFYSGVLSLFAFVFFPFGFHLVGAGQIILSLFAGIIFVYGALFLFFAIRVGEASRVTTVVGATVPIVTFILSIFFLEERLSVQEVIGVAVLIFGGLWISLDISRLSSKRFFSGFVYSIFAGVFLAIAFTLFKSYYEKDNFINVYIWTRFGVIFGAASLFLYPFWRKAILGSLGNFRKPTGENKSSGVIFVLTKALGGMGSIIKEFAASIGSVTIINALVSLEYIFIFIMGVAFSFWLPKVFQEKKDGKSVFQKLTAIVLIAMGLFLVYKF
jgi:drug/metabolite transporter (DMT)-like permease